MALTPENGTGLANANTYADYAYFVAFCAQFGLAGTYTEEQAEPALTTSSIRWIDWQHEFAGEKLTETQALEFPRDNDIGLPLKIKQAAADGAWLHLNNALLVNTATLSTTGEVISERKKLDVLETEKTYAEGSAQTYSRVLPADLENLLRPYLKLSAGFGRAVRVM